MNVLVVGSSVIDLFFKLDDKSHISSWGSSISLRLGDKIPIDIKKIALGGNGANISVGLKRLSIDTAFYTFLGQDLFSKEIEGTIRKEGVDLIAQKVGEKSSLSLILDLDQDRIIFSHHEILSHYFKYEGGLPAFVYLTSIGDDWRREYEEVLEYVKNNNLPLGFNPGSHQLAQKTDIVLEVVKQAKIIFLNKEEAIKILSWIDIQKKEVKELLLEFKNLGPETVSITDGDNGAYALDNEGVLYWIKQFGQNGVDKTGAGDAYTSGFLAKYLHGGSLSECMKWGPPNAFSVVEKYGAQKGLLTLQEMETVLESHPEFKAEEI